MWTNTTLKTNLIFLLLHFPDFDRRPLIWYFFGRWLCTNAVFQFNPSLVLIIIYFLRRVMIDKEKNKAKYRLSHCVNVLFFFDHGTFRWRREDKSSGLFTKIQGQTDIDSRLGQMVSKIHDWQISSVNFVHHLHKSNPFSQKTAMKACNWYQRWLRWRLRWNGTRISAWNIWNRKTLPFQKFCCSQKFF